MQSSSEPHELVVKEPMVTRTWMQVPNILVASMRDRHLTFMCYPFSNLQLTRYMTAQSISSFRIMRYEDLASYHLLIPFCNIALLFRIFLCRLTTIVVFHNHDSYTVFIKLWRYALTNKLKLFKFPFRIQTECAWSRMHVEARQMHKVACKVRIGKYMKTHTFPYWPAIHFDHLLVNFLAPSWRISYHIGYSHEAIKILLKLITHIMLKSSTPTFEVPDNGFGLHVV